MADQYKVVYGLSSGAIFNDLEQPLTQFSRKIAAEYLINGDKDTAIVTIETIESE